MNTLSKKVFVFLTGCFLYSFLEITFRGFTHWTMTLTGGLILVILFEMFTNLKAVPLWQKCLLGSALITSAEFTVGVVVNIILDWNVWNYSDIPLNILGQVCPLFCMLWFFLCIPAYGVCKIIENRLD